MQLLRACRSTENIAMNNTENEYNAALEKLKRHFIRHKLTYDCLEATAELMNSMPGANIQLPTSQYLLLKAFMLTNPFRHQYYIHCDCCKKYVMCSPGESSWGCRCGRILKLRDKNYFVYINLEEQLKNILEKHWDTILAYNNVIESDGSENTTDYYSGIRELMQKNVLSLMINTDGISLKKSGFDSVWPIQLICNFLPPKIRYLNENILCVAFYCQKHKPDMLEFFEPFAVEIDELQSIGFVFRENVFRTTITSAIFDLPAKSSFQQLIQFNGYSACGYCFHKGELTGKGVRYTWQNECSSKRTNESFILAMENVSQNGLEMVDGVKGVSAAVSFDNFDMVKSFGLDYMHNVCLGVMKAMHKFWLQPKYKQDSYICSKLQKRLNQRITSIKPCTFISRLPRSLNCISKYKASEFRSLLLYYLPVALRGIQKKKYLDHFLLLSGSIYQLLGTNISNEDIVVAENNLRKFVEQYEEFYGKENMTMNVHLLTHMVFCVKNLGPLWTQSMYSFESNNATFSRYVKSTSDALAELSVRYMVHKSISRETHTFSETFDKLNNRKKIKLSASEKSALIALINITFNENNLFDIYCVYEKYNERFTSINYSAAKKTIDYVVEMKNGVVGKIKFYFVFESVFFALLEEYEYVDRVLHIHEIKPKNVESVHATENIDKKFIYLKIVNKHYVTNRPNQFERD